MPRMTLHLVAGLYVALNFSNYVASAALNLPDTEMASLHLGNDLPTDAYNQTDFRSIPSLNISTSLDSSGGENDGGLDVHCLLKATSTELYPFEDIDCRIVENLMRNEPDSGEVTDLKTGSSARVKVWSFYTCIVEIRPGSRPAPGQFIKDQFRVSDASAYAVKIRKECRRRLGVLSLGGFSKIGNHGNYLVLSRGQKPPRRRPLALEQ